jgi:hypothetical protein
VRGLQRDPKRVVELRCLRQCAFHQMSVHPERHVRVGVSRDSRQREDVGLLGDQGADGVVAEVVPAESRERL